jgi:hypothetical protein
MTERSTTEAASPRWIDVTPSIWSVGQAQQTIRLVIAALRRLKAEVPTTADIESARAFGVKAALRLRSRRATELAVCVHVFCDLRSQGWKLRCSRTRVSALVPTNGLDAMEEKARVRAAHEVDRDHQLRQPSVRRFVRSMEQVRLHKGEWRSIFSLMRNGAELSKDLTAAASAEDVGAQLLRRVIDPYVQPAIAGRRCDFTGLDLLDVWRYFRHTWTTTYQSTPGRKLFFLVRDRAAACHPVIGIAALGSPIVQLTVRDEWIGWTPETLLRRMSAEPPDKWKRWLTTSLHDLIDGVYVADFIKEGHLRRGDITHPTHEVLDHLKRLAATERAAHRLYPQREQHKRRSDSHQHWPGEARTRLFRSKRAAGLADLLGARLSLSEAGLQDCPPPAWPKALVVGSVRQAIATIVRHVKASHIGIDVMDITVCGAIAPYNHVLGGKLVALLMAAPEVRREYQRRYSHTPSIIASSMAGRSVVRRPRLVLLGTTSLYSMAPSQYNRLRMPLGCEDESLAYAPLGYTVGYGSYHFSQATIAAMEPLLSRLQSGRPVNSIFGEGVNPKLRKVRAALDAIGLPSNLLLQHGSPRVVYGVSLARNFRDVLLGLAGRPDYLLPDGVEATGRIVDYWRERWLSGRIQSQDVRQAVAAHVLTSPLRHGARVTLPTEECDATSVGEETDSEQIWGPVLAEDSAEQTLRATRLYSRTPRSTRSA